MVQGLQRQQRRRRQMQRVWPASSAPPPPPPATPPPSEGSALPQRAASTQLPRRVASASPSLDPRRRGVGSATRWAVALEGAVRELAVLWRQQVRCGSQACCVVLNHVDGRPRTCKRTAALALARHRDTRGDVWVAMRRSGDRRRRARAAAAACVACVRHHVRTCVRTWLRAHRQLLRLFLFETSGQRTYRRL